MTEVSWGQSCTFAAAMSKNSVRKVIVILAATFVILVVAFQLLQDKIIFQGVRLSGSYQFAFDHPFEEHFISTPDGHQINLILFKTSQKPKGLILYFHGNRDNLQRWGNYATDFTKYGYEVLMMDYRGYGKSTGKPNEQVLYADAKLVWQWTKNTLATSPSPLVVYGRSLGTAVASQLAAEARPALLILETPFDELRGAIVPWLKPVFSVLPFSYEFPTHHHLAKTDCRKVIFHGTEDMITPISSAMRLKPLLKEGDEFFVIPQGAHGNLREFKEYHLKLAEVLKQ
ncbi:MAG: alpha/beta hydrolase [Flammeovirgaceae bacterium]